MINPHDPDEPPMAAKYAAFNRYRPRTEVSTTQHAADWNEPDAIIRPATTDQQPAVYGATQPARLVITETVAASRTQGDGPWTTAEAILAALDREGYTVAPRASEATGDAHGPTPDVGAAQGREGGSAAESEPRGTVKRRILEALDRWHEVGADTTGEFAGVMEAVDDYVAAMEQRVRLQVLDEVDAYDAAEARTEAAEGRTEPRVHYEVEMYNDGWSIPIYRTSSVDDARAHEGLPPGTGARTRIVRVTREVIQ